jgi:predicted dehydrogenase
VPAVILKTKSIKVGIVGAGKQGKKLFDLMQQSRVGKGITCTYLDYRDINRISEKKEINKSFDGFIISVPNPSLTEELLFFSQFDKPILIEKPVVNCRRDIDKLRKINEKQKARILVNYPFPYSVLGRQIQNLIESNSLGKVIDIDVIHTHGFAWTSEYMGSWRSTLDLGVISMLMVHQLNYWVSLFGSPNLVCLSKSNFAGSGTAPDTGSAHIGFSSGTTLKIVSSYATPYAFSIRILGTEGIFTYDGESAVLYSPRESLGASGRHVEPKKSVLQKLNFDNNWASGQLKLIELFCDSIVSQEPNFSSFDDAIYTYELVLSSSQK